MAARTTISQNTDQPLQTIVSEDIDNCFLTVTTHMEPSHDNSLSPKLNPYQGQETNASDFAVTGNTNTAAQVENLSSIIQGQNEIARIITVPRNMTLSSINQGHSMTENVIKVLTGNANTPNQAKNLFSINQGHNGMENISSVQNKADCAQDFSLTENTNINNLSSVNQEHSGIMNIIYQQRDEDCSSGFAVTASTNSANQLMNLPSHNQGHKEIEGFFTEELCASGLAVTGNTIAANQTENLATGNHSNGIQANFNPQTNAGQNVEAVIPSTVKIETLFPVVFNAEQTVIQPGVPNTLGWGNNLLKQGDEITQAPETFTIITYPDTSLAFNANGSYTLYCNSTNDESVNAGNVAAENSAVGIPVEQNQAQNTGDQASEGNPANPGPVLDVSGSNSVLSVNADDGNGNAGTVSANNILDGETINFQLEQGSLIYSGTEFSDLDAFLTLPSEDTAIKKCLGPKKTGRKRKGREVALYELNMDDYTGEDRTRIRKAKNSRKRRQEIERKSQDLMMELEKLRQQTGQHM